AIAQSGRAARLVPAPPLTRRDCGRAPQPLVEHDDPRILDDRPGDRDPLALADRQEAAGLTDHRAVAVGQCLDEVWNNTCVTACRSPAASWSPPSGTTSPPVEPIDEAGDAEQSLGRRIEARCAGEPPCPVDQ